jgi:hypothetical protein
VTGKNAAADVVMIPRGDAAEKLQIFLTNARAAGR